MLGLPATNIDLFNSETVTIESYDSNTGLITLVKPCERYHFGQAKSTADDYSGVDMRGEVLLLSSNINITADPGTMIPNQNNPYPKPYGCHMIITTFSEKSGLRAGRANIDNVAFYQCSKEGTDLAALTILGSRYA